MRVSERDLLEGMWFAMQSSGEGLGASVDLLHRGRHAHAAALAMIALEELCKARLLRKFWKHGDAGGVVTLDDVKTVCGLRANHVEKQRAPHVDMEIGLELGSRAAMALEQEITQAREVGVLRERNVLTDSPALEDAYLTWAAAREEFERALQDASPDVAGERFGLRNPSLWVDVEVEQGRVRWKRPGEISVNKSKTAIGKTIRDYLSTRRNLLPPDAAEPGVGGSPRFAAALEAWTTKPELPIPVWP
jgi:AbiV family abortive infection protein